MYTVCGNGTPLWILLLGLGLLSLAVVVVWKIYRRLNWRQGAAFSVALFFMLGFGWLSLKEPENSMDFATAMSSKNQMKWQFSVLANDKVYKKFALVKRHGSEFLGRGQDDFGQFRLAGSFVDDKSVQFNLLYDAEAKRRGALRNVITFFGKLETNSSGEILAQGAYKTIVKKGYEQSIHNPARMVKVGGEWKGNLGKDSELAKRIARGKEKKLISLIK